MPYIRTNFNLFRWAEGPFLQNPLRNKLINLRISLILYGLRCLFQTLKNIKKTLTEVWLYGILML